MTEPVLPTYKAILRGNRLEWRGNARQRPPADRPVAVHVTILDEPLAEINAGEADQGARMAAALERLAEINALTEIDDAATWQRETRQERKMPGRDAAAH